MTFVSPSFTTNLGSAFFSVVATAAEVEADVSLLLDVSVFLSPPPPIEPIIAITAITATIPMIKPVFFFFGFAGVALSGAPQFWQFGVLS